MQKAKTDLPNLRPELLRQLAQALEMGDIAGGLRLAEKAREELTDRDNPATGRFRCLEARLFFASGDYQRALASSRLAASLLAPFGESDELAQAYMTSGMSLVSLGNYRDAEIAFRDAESLFRRCDNCSGQIDTANMLARICFLRAEYKGALKYLLDAVRLADRIGDKRKLAYLWGNLGRVHTFLGNLRKARESLELNIEISAELDDISEQTKAQLSLGYIEMLGEHYDKAETLFADAYVNLIARKMSWNLVIYQTYMGELKTRCGDYNTARRYLNEAVNGARTLSAESSLMVAPLRHLAALDLACGKINAATRMANKAFALAEKTGEAMEKAAALRILAQAKLMAANGDRADNRKATDLFMRALGIYEEVDARFDRAETLVMMAQSHLGSSRRIFASLFRAADIYKQLGISSKFEKTQELINKAEAPVGPAGQAPEQPSDATPKIVTANPRLEKITADLAAAAGSEIPVLLCGETGTGKDLLARYYHSKTGRKGEFVAVNCAAFPETLLEAELFGYRKGAFTGAGADKEGLLHRANGGTFFLDEIGEMSLMSQAKLLTVLESCRTRRLGDTAEEILDIRFIAATNCDLNTMVENGTFRRDLYYRLSGICFTIPSLAERPEDIPVLLHHFLVKEKALARDESLDPALISEFSSRSWPGNVRQLESEIKKLVLFSTMAREDSLGDLAGVLVQDDGNNQTASLSNQVEQFEKALIIKALRKADGNKSQAARSLTIHESTLRAKMKRYDLDRMSIS